MANVKHSTAQSTFLNGSVCRSFIATTDVDNGTLVTMGDLADGEREVYEAEFDVTKPAFLALDVAWVYDDYNYERRNDEAVYTNVACKPFRAYQLKPDQRYKVSTDITTDTLKVGDFVISDANGKLKKAASETNANNAFVGKVIAVDKLSSVFAVGSAGSITTGTTMYEIQVIKNEPVAAASGSATKP